jgi:aminoglycoside 6'-N-acetyltransferase I
MADIGPLMGHMGVAGLGSRKRATWRLATPEMGLRAYANGCDSSPVPYLEGIWVDTAARRRGVGAALVEHLISVARGEGHRELGSDAFDRHTVSLAALRWASRDEERVVCFVKPMRLSRT